ncbi:MAG: hypothetical protein U5K69_04685 [Balneolaceae bacterium]|nr:hypothetical protein [Balneolaceae bacterium]
MGFEKVSTSMVTITKYGKHMLLAFLFAGILAIQGNAQDLDVRWTRLPAAVAWQIKCWR